MKRFSLILSIFVIVLVSCGKTAPVEQEKFYQELVLMRPPSAIVGVESQGRVFDNCDEEIKQFFKGVFIPGRTVKLSPYYIGKYQVTYKLWQEVYTWAIRHGYEFENAGQKGSYGDGRNTENDPVTMVSWYDCIVWCNAYTQMTKGIEQCVYVYSDSNQVIKSTKDLKPSKVKYDQSKKGYRLPTEAEWEFAARYQGSDSTNALRYGDIYLTHLDSLSGAKDKYTNKAESQRVGWYYDNADEKAHPVGEKDPNYAGLYDMSGNVCEWIYDGWEIPSTGTHTNPIGTVSADDRVIRGGSWDGGWGDGAHGCVVGYRNSWWFINRYVCVGFRVACSQ